MKNTPLLTVTKMFQHRLSDQSMRELLCPTVYIPLLVSGDQQNGSVIGTVLVIVPRRENCDEMPTVHDLVSLGGQLVRADHQLQPVASTECLRHIRRERQNSVPPTWIGMDASATQVSK